MDKSPREGDFNMISILDDLSMYDPHDRMMLYYDVENNFFIDVSFGHVVLDIYRLLTPWQITVFKREKVDCVFSDITNTFLVDLVYPDLNEELLFDLQI